MGRKSRKITEAKKKLEQKLGQPPSAREIAQESGLDLREFHETVQDRKASNAERYDPVADDDSYHVKTRYCDPSKLLLIIESKDTLSKALSRLPARERTVASMYYFENMRLKKIGEMLGISESRASQIRSEAVDELKLSFIK